MFLNTKLKEQSLLNSHIQVYISKKLLTGMEPRNLLITGQTLLTNVKELHVPG